MYEYDLALSELGETVRVIKKRSTKECYLYGE